MKCFKTFLLPLLLTLMAVASACKKEKPEPPFGAATLNPGRAAIRFTPSKSINSLLYFDVANTTHTTAQNKGMNVGNVRNVILEATELMQNSMTRKATINMVLRENTTPAINLSLATGLPLWFIHIESYSWTGHTRRSQSGTLTVTRFTSTEIEGYFSVTFDDGTTISDGRFAGKF